jgi:tRNA A37 threonylcarbamoyladenosine dehydratase
MKRHPDTFERSRLLMGQSAIDHLARCRVAVFGLGGVGGDAGPRRHWLSCAD